MRSTLLIAAATCAILAACGQSDDDALGNTAANMATNSGPVLPITDEDAKAANATTASLPTEPVARERVAALLEERHDNYEKIGDAMKLVSRELKGDSPDLAAVRKGAGTIASLAPQIPGWFPPGSGPGTGKTHAKAAIWEKPEDFMAKSTAFTASARAFNAAAQGSDLTAIRAAHGAMGKTCQACHDLYREKE